MAIVESDVDAYESEADTHVVATIQRIVGNPTQVTDHVRVSRHLRHYTRYKSICK